jgi:hypothetical protein
MKEVARYLVTALISALCIATWGVARAQAQTPADALCTVIGTITGDSSVTLQPLKYDVPLADQDPSKPLRGATLTFKGDTTTKRVQTDASGNYRIDLPLGSYSVDVEAPGFNSEHETVTVQRPLSGNICLEFGVGLETKSAAAARAQNNAAIANRNAMLDRPYTATPGPVPPTLGADVVAFNESPASQTSGCRAMVGVINLLATTNNSLKLSDELIEWSMEANAAKICASDTRASAAERLPQFVLSRACHHLKDYFQFLNEVYRSKTSWACGWPAPVPALRTIPGIMPPGYGP